MSLIPSTADLINVFQAFNRKERYHLICEILGIKEFTVDSRFLKKICDYFKIKVKSNIRIFAAMDYHLDWIYAGLFLHFNPDKKLPASRKNKSGMNVVYGNQEDIDFLICLKVDNKYHLLFLEAKGVTDWNVKQIYSKSKRLKAIFGDSGKVWDRVIPHFAFMSPAGLPKLNISELPRWMKCIDKPNKIGLGLSDGLIKIRRCDINLKNAKADNYWCLSQEKTAHNTINKCNSVKTNNSYHFGHLGDKYFRDIAVTIALTERKSFTEIHSLIENISLGRTGQKYDQKINGKRINPNWRVQMKNGSFYSGHPFQIGKRWQDSNLQLITWDKIIARFF